MGRVGVFGDQQCFWGARVTPWPDLERGIGITTSIPLLGTHALPVTLCRWATVALSIAFLAIILGTACELARLAVMLIKAVALAHIVVADASKQL